MANMSQKIPDKSYTHPRYPVIRHLARDHIARADAQLAIYRAVFHMPQIKSIVSFLATRHTHIGLVYQ